jgi:DNA-directed RNA polymerase beta' subunit
MSIPLSKRFKAVLKLVKPPAKKNTQCKHCAEHNIIERHPVIGKKEKGDIAIYFEFFNAEKMERRDKIHPHKIREIFDRVSDATVYNLLGSASSHPSKYLIYIMRVPPTTIRPDVRKMGGGRSTNDPLTSMIQTIIRKNEMLPSVLPDEIKIGDDIDKIITEMGNTYFDLIKGTSTPGASKANESVGSRLKGKQGRFRRNMQGKRTVSMSRAVITGDTSIKVDEVGIPMVFARNIQIPEVVQEYNRKRLTTYFNNGTKEYPGCTKVVKYETGHEHGRDRLDNYTLQIGDTIFRDVINGDIMNFNRQPSIKTSNIAGHRVIVTENTDNLSLRMNVIACPWYDADFDGDAMNGIFPTHISARSETIEMSSARNWFISFSYSSPMVGQADDSVIGVYELSRQGAQLNRYHAMLLYQYSTYLPDFNEPENHIYDGNALISKLLTRTKVNFNSRSAAYNEAYTPYIKYNPKDVNIKVVNGVVESGAFDKKSVGKSGGLNALIARDYGEREVLDFIFNLQQLSLGYLAQYGFSIGISDMLIGKDALAEVRAMERELITDSEVVTDKLNRGEIIPPIGQTVEQFYEEQQINALRSPDGYSSAILSSIDSQTNNLYKLIASGSKGSMSNMENIICAVGQKVINGERPSQRFSYKRTLPYFPRFDTSPSSRGFITNSYISGMTSSEYFFNAMNARFDLIVKALATSVTGDQNRKSIKNLESIMVNCLRLCVKANNIVQYTYGEDGLDSRRVEMVKFPTVMISDADLAKYKYSDSPVFADEFARIVGDRDKYRKIFFGFENSNVCELMTDTRHMPFDIARIIKNVINAGAVKGGAGANAKGAIKASPSSPTSEATLTAMVERVDEFCRKLPYIHLNEIQEQKNSPIPMHLESTMFLPAMLVRSHLNARAFVDLGIGMDELDEILQLVKHRHTRALVDYGSAVGVIAAEAFHAVLTQYMLDAHHRSASGGTSKSGMNKGRELFGAKTVDKLSNPSMLITFPREVAMDKALVREIASEIEMVSMKDLLTSSMIFMEKYNEIVHPRFVNEIMMIREFERMNPLLKPPTDLLPYCIRWELNKLTVILKNISLEYIIGVLRETYPDIHVVHTPENSKSIILRIYIRSAKFGAKFNEKEIFKFKEELFNMVVRGVSGITYTETNEIIRNHVNDAGAIERVKGLHGITTSGTNMYAVMCNKYVDAYRIQSDSVDETYKMFGIEAARKRIISELRSLVEGLNHRHYMIYADEMTYTGRVTSIEKAGLSRREQSNILLRLGSSAPIQVLEEAARDNAVNTVTGMTAPFLMGVTPKMGTLHSKFHLNEKLIAENIKRGDDYLDLL